MGGPVPHLYAATSGGLPRPLPLGGWVRRLRPGLVAAETGPDSAIVRSLLVKSCAGWHVRPARREFYDAVRATFPTSRQCSLIRTWASEASIAEIIVAWAERAYTIRQLVAALHRAEFAWPERIREINQWAGR